MKSELNHHIFLLICAFSLSFSGCKIVRLPSLSTTEVTDITSVSARAGGNISFDGNTQILVRGVCWSTSKTPTTEDPRTTDGYGVGVFTSELTDLIPNTLYYVRAYATNKEGTAYGNQLTFTTDELSVATLTTVPVTGITQISAVSGGNITFDGGTGVSARGVCWATHTVPTLADFKTSDGSGSGTFASNITGLTGNTRYYVRAYAVNEVGTGYGQEVSFITSPLLPALTTTDPSPAGTTTARAGGNISSDGGSAVTARGVCWSTSPNPTINNNKTTDGAGSGPFISNITGLAPNTQYHVRAYATNSVGTSYGSDKVFTTDPVSVQDYDNNVYDVIRIGTQVWLKANLKTTHFNNGTTIPEVTGGVAWGGLSTPGLCWYNNNGSNKDTYGALYNWYAVDAGNLCPTGWRVSTDEDWIVLENYLGGSSPAGGELKEAGYDHWTAPNTGATNESNFTALPGGWRINTGAFEFNENYGFWWTSTEYLSSGAYFRKIQYDFDRVFRSYSSEVTGMSVRCIKN